MKVARALVSIVMLIVVVCAVLASLIAGVHATSVVYIKMHNTPSTFTDPSGFYDGYTPGANVRYHIYLNVTLSLGGSVVAITNLTTTDTLPAGLTYVSGSQLSVPAAVNFSAVGQVLIWNWSSTVLNTVVHPPEVPAGDLYEATVEFNATVDSTTPDSTYLPNIATASYNEVITHLLSRPGTSDTIWVAYPILDIIKQNPAKVENGSSFNYVLTLNNTGELDATGVNVTDTLPSGVIHTPGTSIATSGTFVVDSGTQVIWTGTIGNDTGSHIVTITIPVKANTAAGSVFNIASYTAYPSYAQFTHSSANCTTVVLHPAITLTKTPSSSKVETGSAVNYTYVVTNTGDTSLTVNLTDDMFGTIFTGKVLAAGASNITTVSQTLTANTTNIATATGVDQTGASASANATATVQVIHPAITLTKTPSASKVLPGGSITYTYTVTNTGDTPLTVSLVDNMFGTIFTGKVLAAGASNVTTISQVLTASTTNVATATGVDQTGVSVSATATAFVQVPQIVGGYSVLFEKSPITEPLIVAIGRALIVAIGLALALGVSFAAIRRKTRRN